MQLLLLNWSGPYSLHNASSRSLFKNETGVQPGLYVWTVAVGERARAYYVGETGDTFARRHRAHLKSYRTGSYTIHSAEGLRAGRMDPLYRGFLYSRTARATQEPEFTRRRVELEVELERCFEVIEIYLAPLRADQRTRRRVETGLLDRILASGAGLKGLELEKWSRWPRTADEATLTVSVEGLPLRGFPSTFEA